MRLICVITKVTQCRRINRSNELKKMRIKSKHVSNILMSVVISRNSRWGRRSLSQCSRWYERDFHIISTIPEISAKKPGLQKSLMPRFAPHPFPSFGAKITRLAALTDVSENTGFTNQNVWNVYELGDICMITMIKSTSPATS
jgi:hypothetical protein